MLAGIFVGGASSRMGRPKGLLPSPDGPSLVARWQRLFDALSVPYLLVGDHPAYASLGIQTLPDVAGSSGPLAGLVALLAHGARAKTHQVIAVACDMPYVTEALLRRLISAPPANAVAPRFEGHWEPFFARFDVAHALPVAEGCLRDGRRSLKSVLDAIGTELVLAPEEAALLRDWDTPEDLQR